MNAQPSPTAPRRIIWSSVITVVSAAILMPPETFYLSIPQENWAHVLQAILFAIGVFVMVVFLRTAQTVEPFTRRG